MLTSMCWYWFSISIGRYLNKSYQKGQTTTITVKSQMVYYADSQHIEADDPLFQAWTLMKSLINSSLGFY